MSLVHCLSTRPPLVVFVLSLFAFALTTLIMAVTVDSSGRIKNPDVLDWDTFFNKLSQLDYCVQTTPIHANDSSSNTTEEANDSNNSSSASLLVPVTSRFLSDFHSAVGSQGDHVVARGEVLMDHLDRGRLAKYHGMTVTLTLNLPTPTHSDGGDRLACVGLTAPSSLLNDLNAGSAPNSCSQHSSPSSSVLSFETHSRDHLPPGWCSSAANDSVAMELTYEERPEWVVYISGSDRRLVSLHLACMSAFLFALGAVAVVMAFFGACRGGDCWPPGTRIHTCGTRPLRRCRPPPPRRLRTAEGTCTS